VRTKLSNVDDLSNFAVTLSMAEAVLGDTVQINAGDGEWDRLKRTVTWKLPLLSKGESFMLSARGLLQASAAEQETLEFPVMLRCKSQDQISSAKIQAIEASGYPATVSSSTVGPCRFS